NDTVFTTDIRQARDTPDVHNQPRLGQPQLHQRQQAVPAGQDLGVGIFQQPDGFVQTSGSRVREFGRKHQQPSSVQCAPAVAGSDIATSGFSNGSSPRSLRPADRADFTMF